MREDQRETANESAEDTKTDGKGFWASSDKVLGGVAAVIGAIAGLIVALNSCTPDDTGSAKVSQPTATSTSSSTPASSSTTTSIEAPSISARFVLPAGGATVLRPTEVKATFTGRPPEGMKFWLVSSNAQGTDFPHKTSDLTGESGTFVWPRVWIGGPDGAGNPYVLTLVLTDAVNTARFDAMVGDGQRDLVSGDGVKVLDEIQVVRG